MKHKVMIDMIVRYSVAVILNRGFGDGLYGYKKT